MNKLVALKSFSYGRLRLKRGMEFTPKSRPDERLLIAVLLAKKSATDEAVPTVEKVATPERKQPSIDGLRLEFERVRGEPADKRWGRAMLERKLAEARETTSFADDANE